MLPLLLNHTGSIRVLIVGGGKVALRRLDWLHQAGINAIELISPKFIHGITSSTPAPVLLHEEYSSRDLSRFTLILACTDNPEVNSHVASDAREQNILLNRADDPEASDFHVPAEIRRGDVIIAINTGIPALSQKLKESINSAIPDNAEIIASRLRRLRTLLQNTALSTTEIKDTLRNLCRDEKIPALLSLQLENTDNEELLRQLIRISKEN